MVPTAMHHRALRQFTSYRWARPFPSGTVRAVQWDPFQVSANVPMSGLCGKSLVATARQAEDDEHDTAPKARSVVPAGSGGACIRHVGVVAAAAFLATALVLAAGPVASAPASPATAMRAPASAPAATGVRRPETVRLILIIHPRMVSCCCSAPATPQPELGPAS
jgi:hypothetical protein